MGTTNQRYYSPLRSPRSSKPVRHVHFEDEARGRSRQRTTYEKASRRPDIEKENLGPSRYWYRCRGRSRSRSRSHERRRPTFPRNNNQNERDGAGYRYHDHVDGAYDMYPRTWSRTERPHKYEIKKGDDRHYSETPSYVHRRQRTTVSDNLQEHLHYLRDISTAQAKRHYYPESEHVSYRSSYRGTSRTKEHRHDSLPRRETSYRTSEPARYYYEDHPSKDKSCRYDSYRSSSLRSSGWLQAPSPSQASYSQKEPLHDPMDEYHRYQYARSRSHRRDAPQYSEPTRMYRRPFTPERSNGWHPVKDASIVDSSEYDGRGGTRIRIRYRYWV
jgi:hypothetical protein